MASRMSCAHGTSSQTTVQCSSETALMIHSGLMPRRSTALPPTRKLPNQCIFAPVWYSGGMQRNVSSRVWPWCFCSTMQACMRLRWRCTMAFGNPVVPEEK